VTKKEDTVVKTQQTVDVLPQGTKEGVGIKEERKQFVKNLGSKTEESFKERGR